MPANLDWMMPFLVLAGIGLAVRAVQWWSDPRTKARRHLKRQTNVLIADVKEGAWVKVTGTVSPLEPTLKSPIGEHACIGFRSVIKRTHDGHDEVLFAQQACVSFSIDDGTGRAIAEGPFLIGLDLEGGWTRLPPLAFSYLEEVASTGAIDGDNTLRCSEALLKPGDRVSLFGQASHELDRTERGAGLRSPSVVVRFQGSRRERLVLADADEHVSR